MPQGLDRLIVLSIEAEGTRDDQGHYVPGAVTDSSAWATRRDKTLDNIVEGGGDRAIAERAYTVRWRADLAAAVPSRVKVTDGVIFQVSNILETEDRRRRFMILETTAEVTP